MRTARLFSLAFAAAASVAGCQSGATNPQDPEPPSDPLTVAPSYATLNGGQVIRLTVTLAGPNGSKTTPDNVRWSSADERIASVGQDGTVHALQAGRVLIIAEYKASRGSSLVQVADQVSKKGGACLARLEGGTGSSAPRPCA